jgi:hypothetical protein
MTTSLANAMATSPALKALLAQGGWGEGGVVDSMKMRSFVAQAVYTNWEGDGMLEYISRLKKASRVPRAKGRFLEEDRAKGRIVEEDDLLDEGPD